MWSLTWELPYVSGAAEKEKKMVCRDSPIWEAGQKSLFPLQKRWCVIAEVKRSRASFGIFVVFLTLHHSLRVEKDLSSLGFIYAYENTKKILKSNLKQEKGGKMLNGTMSIICQSYALIGKISLKHPVNACQVLVSTLCSLNHLVNGQDFSLLSQIFSEM